MTKRLIGIFNSKKKTPEQLWHEMMEALKKYEQEKKLKKNK